MAYDENHMDPNSGIFDVPSETPTYDMTGNGGNIQAATGDACIATLGTAVRFDEDGGNATTRHKSESAIGLTGNPAGP